MSSGPKKSGPCAYGPEPSPRDFRKGRTLLNRVVVTATVGATVEWYDFFVYGLLATIVGKHFFPPGDPVAQTLAAPPFKTPRTSSSNS